MSSEYQNIFLRTEFSTLYLKGMSWEIHDWGKFAGIVKKYIIFHSQRFFVINIKIDKLHCNY